MPERKIVALASTKEHVASLLPVLAGLEQDGRDHVAVIGLEYAAQIEFAHHGLAYKIPDDYVAEDTYLKLDEQAILAAQKWYGANWELVTYEGVNLAKVVEWEFTYFLAGVMRYIDLAKCIYDAERPDEVILPAVGRSKKPSGIIEGPNEHLVVTVARMIADVRGITVSRVPCPGNSFKESRTSSKKVLLAVAGLTVRTLALLRRLSPDRSRYHVLMATGWDIAAPVVRTLRKTPGIKVGFLARDPVISKTSPLANLQYQTKTFKDYSCRETRDKTVQARQLFQERWNSLLGDKNLQGIMTYRGVTMWSLVGDRLGYLFSTRFVELANEIVLLGRMLNKSQVDLIVLNNGVSEFDRTVIAVADRKGIPTLINQREMAEPAISWLPFYAGKLACWGKITRDWLVGEGVNPGRIEIVGASRFDGYLQESKSRIGKETTIVLGTQHSNKGTYFANLHLSQHEDELLLRSVMSAMKTLPEARLVIKLHPGDENSTYKERIIASAVNECGIDNVSVTRFADIAGLLRTCDILITPWSTVGLEAMILGKPVIQINLTGRQLPDFTNLYAASGAAIGVYRPEDIAPAIRSILNDQEVRQRLEENRKRFVFDYCYLQDGKASQRVAELIIKTIEESRAETIA